MHYVFIIWCVMWGGMGPECEAAGGIPLMLVGRLVSTMIIYLKKIEKEVCVCVGRGGGGGGGGWEGRGRKQEGNGGEIKRIGRGGGGKWEEGREKEERERKF